MLLLNPSSIVEDLYMKLLFFFSFLSKYKELHINKKERHLEETNKYLIINTNQQQNESKNIKI